MSMEARRPIRDGDEWEKGDRRVRPGNRRQPPKTKAAVDRRQNNRTLRQCPSGIAQRPQHHAIAVPTASVAEQSHKNNVRSSAVG